MMAVPLSHSEEVKRAKGPSIRPRVSYKEDYYGWIQDQVARLKAHDVQGLDFEHLAEELKDMGLSEYKAMRSALKVVLLHMLKWDYQPNKRTRSWMLSIKTHRRHVLESLEESPSLKSQITKATTQAYLDAKDQASSETGLELETFPQNSPYAWEEIMEREFSEL